MGKASRSKPVYLAEKLLKVRNSLGLSQTQMLRLLGIADEGYRNYISDFENNKREPPLPVLLRYAQLAGVWMDVLVDDEIDLPEKLPSSKKHEGLKRESIARRKKKS
jgi:transcriptional regulator with XRE-family HTH domain